MDIERICTDGAQANRHQMSVNSKLGTWTSLRSLWGTILGCAIFALVWPLHLGFIVARAISKSGAVSKFSTWMSLRSLWGTILGCAILASLTWSAQGGFMVFVPILFLLFLLPYSAFVMWSEPVRRRLQAVKVCLWLAVAAGSCCLHEYYETAARAAADEVIRAVLAYKEKTGSYPERLQDAGVVLDERGGRWRIHYFVDGNYSKTYSLRYLDTYRPFSVYTYKFEARRWFWRGG